MPRIFLAINLTPEIKNAIAAHVQQLKLEWPKATISWVRPENLHLTIKFIGEVSAERLSDIPDAIDRAVAAIPPFEIGVFGTGAFPPKGAPRVLWIGIDGSDTVSRLQASVDGELATVGFPLEAKKFHPHLTVGRVRAARYVREVDELHRRIGFQTHLLAVQHLSVIESTLARTGATYSERSKHELRLG